MSFKFSFSLSLSIFCFLLGKKVHKRKLILLYFFSQTFTQEAFIESFPTPNCENRTTLISATYITLLYSNTNHCQKISCKIFFLKSDNFCLTKRGSLKLSQSDFGVTFWGVNNKWSRTFHDSSSSALFLHLSMAKVILWLSSIFTPLL